MSKHLTFERLGSVENSLGSTGVRVELVDCDGGL